MSVMLLTLFAQPARQRCHGLQRQRLSQHTLLVDVAPKVLAGSLCALMCAAAEASTSHDRPTLRYIRSVLGLPGRSVTVQPSNEDTARWLALCGLNGPNASAHLINAACADLRRGPDLLFMLSVPPDDFLRWWHIQDHTGWAMTEATASTDWAWLVLARLGFEVQRSQFGQL
ncbi:hypothetical protein [Ideonella sp.]|uniref:hypothetical protein n=1 Tax=Ideonella sp. TaxID=1929293 RepID=UPI003BB70A90